MRKQQTASNLPSFAQTVNLALRQVKQTLQFLDEFARRDEEFGSGDVEPGVESALTAVMHVIEWLEANPPKEIADFTGRWDTVIGIADIANRVFARECVFKTFLGQLDREVIVLAESVILAFEAETGTGA